MRPLYTSLAICSLIPTLSIAVAQTPVIQGTLTAGQTTIKGAGSPPVAAGAAGAVSIYICVAALSPSPLPAAPACTLPKAAPLAAAALQPVTTGPAGEFTAQLASPLIAGYYVYVSQVSPAGAINSAVATVTAATAAPPGYDWGRVRAYFTLGALLSQQDNQFSHADTFLDFQLDKTYALMGNIDETGNHSWKPGLNSFFETRLTALPVAVQSCPTITTTTTSTTTPATTSSSTALSPNCASASTTATPTTTATTTTTGTTTAAPDQTTAFLNSQKSARLLFGVYIPFQLDRWSLQDKDSSGNAVTTPYALFIGPLIKTGFDTSINGLNQTQQGGSTPSAVQAVGNSNEFYKFYDFGFRLGHVQLSGQSNKAHEIISYLDVTWGRFSNMASLLCPASAYQGNDTCNTSPLTTSMTSSGTTTTTSTILPLPWAHDYRLNVEGLLEIPGTNGFSIGFSTNVAAKGGQPSTSVVHIRPQDDLRFLFAYNCDISKIAAKLAGQQ